MAEILLTKNGVFATARVGELQLAQCSADSFSDDTWREHLEQQQQLNRKHGPLRAMFVWSKRAGPSAAQRKIAVEIAERAAAETPAEQKVDKRHVAIVSESKLVRMLASPFEWVFRSRFNLRFFHPAAVEPAFEWLTQVARFDRDESRATLQAMLTREGGSRTFHGGIPEKR